MALLIPSFGRIYLGPDGDEKQLTTDPEPYEPYKWAKRHSIHQILNGGTIIQDFGVWSGDRILTLKHESLDNELVKAIDGYYRTRGQVFHLTDWLGNDFDVFIQDFSHVPDLHLAKSQYQLEARVITINKAWGATYSGG
jgi:hypothetical protein